MDKPKKSGSSIDFGKIRHAGMEHRSEPMHVDEGWVRIGLLFEIRGGDSGGRPPMGGWGPGGPKKIRV